MEFWGVEVKAGESVKVVPDEGSMIHMSQAALGDSKGKGKGFIPLRVKIEDKKFILGSLSEDSIPHVTFDLVFHTEFELSHDSKDASVFFLGYKGETDEDEGQGFPSDSEDESLNSEDELAAVNDETLKKLLASSNGAKPKSDDKPKVAVKEAVKDDDSSDSDEEDDDSSDDDDVPAIGQEDDSDDDSDDDDDEEDSSEEEETPKEVKRGKKRNAESPKEIPSSAKKAKVGTQPSKPAAAVVKAAAVNKSKGQAQKFQANKGKKGGK